MLNNNLPIKLVQKKERDELHTKGRRSSRWILE